METCEDCVFYEQPKKGYVCGTCDYPVPAYIRIMVPGGNFLNYPVQSNQCATFKSKKDAAYDVLKDKSND